MGKIKLTLWGTVLSALAAMAGAVLFDTATLKTLASTLVAIGCVGGTFCIFLLLFLVVFDQI